MQNWRIGIIIGIDKRIYNRLHGFVLPWFFKTNYFTNPSAAKATDFSWGVD